MSSISQTGDYCKISSLSNIINNLIRSLEGFMRTGNITKTAKIYHGEYSYDLIPDTAISNFMNMKRVTHVEAGDCYVCIFEKPDYQGNYCIIGPQERITVGACGSIIAGINKLPIHAIQKKAKPPAHIWGISGPMYQYHFFSGYKYV
ncbi:MAG: hypothetical protein K6T65_02065 [Peptococcaceae bacterium]|nr:hypothetical protein [Peptococcaceae bacterium]